MIQRKDSFFFFCPLHNAVVEAFEVPERDRYQVVNVHSADEIVALDTVWVSNVLNGWWSSTW